MRKDEFRRRRRQLMKLMGKGGIVILPAVPEKPRNGDVHYHYRPDSDFFYLTGFAEPEAVAVLIPGRAQAEYVLFVRDRDPTRETWDGRRAGPAGATRDYGADDAFPISDIDDILPGLMENCSRVYYTMGMHQEFDQRVIGWVNGLKAQGQSRSGVQPPQEFVALDHLLHDMRLFKSRPEVDAMRQSARIAAAAHKRAMRFARPGRTEYEVMAELLHEFRRNNADISYHPIVGGGANACILHYHENSETLADGDLLLIDAGCEYELYASDITRTFPVNGRFTPEHPQRQGTGADQGGRVPALLHASHRPLARHGRARRRRLQDRRAVARPRARNDADRRARYLHSRRLQGRREALVEHRCAHRGRRCGDRLG
jgi:Xaa-Pro aminopeptidase